MSSLFFYEAPSDYTSVELALTFSMGIVSHSIPVMVVNDSLLEYAEVFWGNLKHPEGSTSSIELFPSIANVTITDKNAAVIGFSGNYTVTEGDTVNLELEVLSGSLGREVVVSVSTADGTAQGKF